MYGSGLEMMKGRNLFSDWGTERNKQISGFSRSAWRIGGVFASGDSRQEVAPRAVAIQAMVTRFHQFTATCARLPTHKAIMK